jgi:predicted glycogen debranching enzyme
VTVDFSPSAEWLEADGLGGFASGTVSGVRTRRYHALLLSAAEPPTGRFILVNGFEAWVETAVGRFAISSQRYLPDVTFPDGAERLTNFKTSPWPRWTFSLEDGTVIEQEIFVPHGISACVVSWRIQSKIENPKSKILLLVRPLLSGRDFHSLHHENPAFRMEAEDLGGPLRFRPYEGVPGVVIRCNTAAYDRDPEWYRNFLYEEERERGCDFSEDLASPGTFRFDLSKEEGVWTLSAEGHEGALGAGDAPTFVKALRASEIARRGRFTDRLERSGDAYLVRRGEGKTILAGYPWFADWGRDTFISLRGLCLATGRLDEAGQVLLEWAGAVSQGMLPNRFPESGQEPEFNSVDASLWFVVAAHEWREAMGAERRNVPPEDGKNLDAAVHAILTGYTAGTRFRIRADVDGLLSAGEPGLQLTWMDAKVGDRVITPRIGKPVEVEALWLNALKIGGLRTSRWNALFERGLASFRRRFWNEQGGYLYDVVDPDHREGAADATFRPNQIFAVGGLPFSLLEDAKARRVVDLVEEKLWTPLGLRTLAPDDPDYHPRYAGGVLERDGAYHQGTAWPWLLGPFVEAWVRVRSGTSKAKREARQRFLEPLLAHLDEAGIGHLPEVADGDPPQRPGGCPFQAWSVGEALRLDRVVLSEAGRGV